MPQYDNDIPSNKVKEWGRTGVLRDAWGIPYYDPNPDMHPYRARGLLLDHGEYHRMWTSDGTVNGIFSFIQREIMRAVWSFKEIDKPTREEKRALELARQVFGVDGGKGTIEGGLQHLIMQATLCYVYGFSLFEVMWKKDVPVDGLNRIVPHKIKWRAPWSIKRWIYRKDDLVGCTQETQNYLGSAPNIMIGDTDHTFTEVFLPMNKCLLFQHMAVDGNPEGRSLFRSSYIWVKAKLDTLFRDQIAQDRLFEGVFFVKEMGDKNGVFKTISDQDAIRLSEMLANLREGLTNRVLIPYGVDIVAEWPGFDAPNHVEEFKYYDHQILLSAASTILGLDANAAASRGLSDGLGAIAYHVIESFASDIARTINGDGRPWTGIVQQIIDINIPNYKGRYPELVFAPIRHQDAEKMTNTLAKAVQFLLYTPTEHDEVDFRKWMGLKELDIDVIKKVREQVNQRNAQSNQGDQRPQQQVLKPGEVAATSKKEKK